MNTHPVTDTRPGLGRIPSPDFRDRLFAVQAPLELPTVTVRHYRTGPVLDQGTTSQCVAYSGEQFLVSGQVTNKYYKTPLELYKECQEVDEWPGNDYDGTSVRALAKILKVRGYLSTYNWAFNLNAILNHVLTIGPVVFGTTWYNSMFQTDKDGFIRVYRDSGIAGGHAYMIKGANTKKQCPDGSLGALRMVNSWGRDFGENGFAWLSFKDCNSLISDWGECLIATEIKHMASPSVYSRSSEEDQNQICIEA